MLETNKSFTKKNSLSCERICRLGRLDPRPTERFDNDQFVRPLFGLQRQASQTEVLREFGPENVTEVIKFHQTLVAFAGAFARLCAG